MAATKTISHDQLRRKLTFCRTSFARNSQSRDWSCYQNEDCGDQLLSSCHEMNDKSQRVAGIFIAPLIMLAWAVAVFG
jgi:hypothetical protein